MKCKICEARRPRRFCPGVDGDICSVCCGTEREVTVNCPLDCMYLREARLHDKDQEIAPGDMPNADIEITSDFIHKNERLISYLAGIVVQSGLSTPGAVDLDVREALDALVRTYRTLESGLYYESRPANALAAETYVRVQAAVEEFRKQVTSQSGLNTVRDTDVLGSLAFLQRIERQQNNGRPRSRAFLDFIRGFFAAQEQPSGVSPGRDEPSIFAP